MDLVLRNFNYFGSEIRCEIFLPLPPLRHLLLTKPSTSVSAKLTKLSVELSGLFPGGRYVGAAVEALPILIAAE